MLKKWICGACAVVVCTIAQAAAPLEPYRPHYHFTPATNWMNDPNGMFYLDGEYHLLYQFNPFGNKWGHMSWGHAVSRDLLHWEHLPIALYEENGIMIFSGSAVVDWKNTSGFGKGGKPPVVAIYTGHYTAKPLQNQQIAYSNDRGRTWTKFSGNPVLDIGEKDFRDPKVFWHEQTKKWVMAVAWPVHRKVRFYSSPNLKEWTHLSDFGPAGSTKGIWECPDLFPLAVEGSRNKQKWALIVNVGSGAPASGSGCQYFVGEFDGAKFTQDNRTHARNPEFVPDGKVLADFEGPDYSNWKAAGNAFGGRPASGTLPNQQQVSGFRGAGLANSYLHGDKSEGTLTSPHFTLDNKFLCFLIGGGNHANKTCLNLLVDGAVVRTATGDADEKLSWKSWNVSDLRGKRAQLQVVDQHTGGWGHINVDHILIADQPARSASDPALWADWGPDFYAAVSWSDIPRRDRRRLWIGWMSNWEYAQETPTFPWRSAMSLPRELTLRDTGHGFRLIQHPVREMKKIRGKAHRLSRASIEKASSWLQALPLNSRLLELDLKFSNPAPVFNLRLLTGPEEQTIIGLAQDTLFVDRTKSGKTQFHQKFPGKHHAQIRNDGGLILKVLVDASSIEVFANNGETVMTEQIFPTGNSIRLLLESPNVNAVVEKLSVQQLKP